MDPLEEAKGKKQGELNMLHRRLWSLRRLVHHNINFNTNIQEEPI